MEQQLFQHFFPKERGESGAVAPLVDPLCTILYDMLRPAIIQLQSLDQLCELIAILQHEVGPAVGQRLGSLRSACNDDALATSCLCLLASWVPCLQLEVALLMSISSSDSILTRRGTWIAICVMLPRHLL